jgi:hypothetical protein
MLNGKAGLDFAATTGWRTAAEVGPQRDTGGDPRWLFQAHSQAARVAARAG